HGRIEKRIYVKSDDHTNVSVTLRLTGVVNSAQPFHMTIGNLEYMFYLLVDLRDADTYADAHLMGAINVPVDKLSEWTDRLPKKALVILYDEDGTLSDPAAKALNDQGFSSVKSLMGGLDEWMNVLGDEFILRADQ
ncbi:MAG: rhodanese-like domain-containing protein, partial [Candidatus Bipolaricaulota bacterium]|nr:rhodanese-like domain-containing protein [Candidatus Bipolaricaulota bacterium]